MNVHHLARARPPPTDCSAQSPHTAPSNQLGAGDVEDGEHLPRRAPHLYASPSSFRGAAQERRLPREDGRGERTASQQSRQTARKWFLHGPKCSGGPLSEEPSPRSSWRSLCRGLSGCTKSSRPRPLRGAPGCWWWSCTCRSRHTMRQGLFRVGVQEGAGTARHLAPLCEGCDDRRAGWRKESSERLAHMG